MKLEAIEVEIRALQAMIERLSDMMTAAAQAEREACAVIAEKEAKLYAAQHGNSEMASACEGIARSIRARGRRESTTK